MNKNMKLITIIVQLKNNMIKITIKHLNNLNLD